MALLVKAQTGNFVIDKVVNKNSLNMGQLGEDCSAKNGVVFSIGEIKELLKGDKIVKTKLSHCKEYLPQNYANAEWLAFSLHNTKGSCEEQKYIITTNIEKERKVTFLASVDNLNKFVELLIGDYEGFAQEGLKVIDNPLCGNSDNEYKLVEVFDLCGDVLFCTEQESQNIDNLRTPNFEDLVKLEYGKPFVKIEDENVEN